LWEFELAMTEKKDPIKLIIGLGNPPDKYAGTRHNVGALIVERIAARYNVVLSTESKFHGLCATIEDDGCECKLLFPMTYMNCSGQAVRAVVNFYKIPLAAVLVVHDELDFAAGIGRFKFGGGSNGHNGVQNIVDQLHSKDFYRLRVGIGKPADVKSMVDYVLTNPSGADRGRIDLLSIEIIKVVPDLLRGDIAKATQCIHSLSLIDV
jgi:peptidyl-tRNA hydrolase, PTH1 family